MFGHQHDNECLFMQLFMETRSPVEAAGCISKVFYSWMNPIFKVSRKQPLTMSDVFGCPSVEMSEYVTEKLEQEWNKERSKKHPSLLKATFKAHILLLLVSAVTIGLEMVCYSFRPFVVQNILLGFTDMSVMMKKIQATLYCLLLICITLATLFLRNASFWMAYVMGMRLRIATSGLIYKKILRLNQKALSETAAGQIINLLSTDVQRFELTFMFLHYGWIGPLQGVAVFWLMSEIDLYPTLCAAAVMIFFIPMQTIMNRAYARLKFRISKVTDTRIRMLSDIINGVKIIKLHAWENLFSKLVSEIRRKETRLFLFVRLCQAFQYTQLVYQVKVTTMAMVLAIVLLHRGPGDPEALRSNKLYALLNYLNSLFLSLTLFMPLCIQYFYDTKVSSRRIQDFLLIPEMERERKPHVVGTDLPQLQFYDVSASWIRKNEGNLTLKNVSFDVVGPKLIAVVGTVGSGKSSLLQVALGELPYCDGFVMRSNSVSYMPQSSWIFPGTVRDNVLCSLPYNHERYARVLKATTLDIDIQRLLHGDFTQVGERGVSLSGGQKARIGLARVAYAESTMVLLDDPLAAVDARVANHLFEECICGVLSNRLRILVTHQHHLLPRMDKIIVMKEGTITHVGTYDQLVAEGVNFHKLVLETEGGETTALANHVNLDTYNDDEVSDKLMIRSRNTSYRSDGVIALSEEAVEACLLLSEQQTKQTELCPEVPIPRISTMDRYPPRSTDLSMGSLDMEQSQVKPSKEFSSAQNVDELSHQLEMSGRANVIVERKRTCSSMESSNRNELHGTIDRSNLTRSMSHCGSKTRRRFREQDSLSNCQTSTPRGSVTSRLAVSLENAVTPSLGAEESGVNKIDDYDENEDEKRFSRKLRREKEVVAGSLDIFITKNDLSQSKNLVEEDEEMQDTAIAEEFQHGEVKWRHYRIFGQIGGGICGFPISILLFILTITNHAGCDVWLTKWSGFVDERSLNSSSASNSTSNNSTPTYDTLPIWDIRNNRVALSIYCCLTASLVLLSSLRSLVFFGVLINSAKRLHKGMLNACMRTRLTFFEENPSGRILNRFAKDIGQLDDYLPNTIHDFLQCFFLVVSIGVVTIASSYWIIIPTIPILILFYFTRRYYVFTSRDLKRIESVARSPVFSWVNVTIQGLPCIRASGSEAHHLQCYNRVMDLHTSVFYMNIAASRWLAIRLDLLCTMYLTGLVIICLLLGSFSHVSSAEVGLMVTYATTLIGLFQWCVRQSAEVENQMVSVERTIEYMDLEPEITKPPIFNAPDNWPTQGKIVFDGLWLRYSTNAAWALSDIKLSIDPGQKVGIVGRTGAGKSSLISAIFRLVEAENGHLLIDDVDISHLELSELRKRISIIPQDPIMFSGTVRSNLDPDGNLSDEKIWDVLTSVQLSKIIASLPFGLQAPITASGANFSTGQRQLLALARAMLGGNRILVVDEATANVDPGTDFVIQKTIRSQFASCTVLTVAHRLHTVIDNELIVVMEGGRIVEVGAPHELLNPEVALLDRHQLHENFPVKFKESISLEKPVSGVGPFAALVNQTGVEEAGILANMARKSFIQTLMSKRRTSSTV
ncbi:hypothetical protein FGIG_04960 [Fasciola gigantica]|uniref:Multidrug resistance-associated protein 4 n=1 Tax=Fasciola gigantica TaxID=46835 RepID=A0A504Y6Q2_FASGI|nr:hypothetical protein FGIG_04960 [Fasciola gigantica]